MKSLTIRAALLAAASLAAALSGLNSASAQTTTPVDYDFNNNGLIEITNLAQLDAMRYDLGGKGRPSQANRAKYNAAFPNAADNMGCPATGSTTECQGYELRNSLTFDTDGDGDVDANDEYPNWTPIGTLAAPFKAEFNGNGHSISRLKMRTAAQDAGLFGRLDGATVGDLNLLKADVASESDHPYSTLGALAGMAVGGGAKTVAIEGVYVTGRVVGTATHVGGLLGHARVRALIKSSCANATVASNAAGPDPRAGGLIATVHAADASNPSNLFGVCALGDVYAVDANAKAGGLIGYAAGETVNIRAAYARGDVSASGGRSVAGGLAGIKWSKALEITASYSTGKVSAGWKAGAIIGAGSPTVSDSYWDSTTSGIADDANDDSPEGKATAELQRQTSAAGIYAGWDDMNLGDAANLVSPWVFGTRSQYPVLNWGNLLEADQRIDYDSDNDGFIEITTPAQLNAARYDLDGNGSPSQAGSAEYAAAFRAAVSGMGCSTTPCKGYELDFDITFDVNGDGMVDSRDPYPNWTPIGDSTNPFATEFNGNGHTISKMTIDSSAYRVGMFGVVGANAKVKNVGLLDADVTAATASPHASVGALAGRNYGTIESSYARGRVSTARSNTVGGFVGGNNGWIAGCWADVAVSSSGNRSRTGGFVGVNYNKIIASYSRGNVSARTHRVGGFAGVMGIGGSKADVKSSYSVGKPSGSADAVSGLEIGGFTPLVSVARDGTGNDVHNSYWDSATSGATTAAGLAGGAPKTTSELQSPMSATGIYANWQNLDMRNDGEDKAVDAPWIFGTASQYPVLDWGDLGAEDQYEDYDADGDALIEISTLAQLNAVRWDLDGDGAAANADKANYALAFPYAATGMGCPSTGCDGYELAGDLTFDTDGDGDVDSEDAYSNWTPIGDATNPFAAEFEGNGRAISNLKINGDAANVGLFGVISSDGSAKSVRLPGADVTSNAPTLNANAGALAGEVAGAVEASYAGGTAAFAGTGAGSAVGGLVGKVSGTIKASWSDASVSGAGGAAGGLVGKVESGAITASYARGNVESDAANANVGGLIGATSGAGSAVSASYSTGKPTSARTTGVTIGGLVGSAAAGTTFTASYWDATNSGVADDLGDASPEGKTTSDLQTPTAAAGIYNAWDDLDLTDDGVANAVDDPWVFGSASHYPALVWGGLRADDQYEDYDADDDGLIAITDLAQLDAIRHDLNGDGAPAKATAAAYRAAFPGAASDMGCPYDTGCVGYELDADEQSLTFPTPTANWTPIANSASPFTATFDGNGQSISGLTISDWDTRMGLFGKLNGATIRNLRLKNVNVSPATPASATINSWAGALAGEIRGGSVVTNVSVDGRINAGAGNVGGLAGLVREGATVTASCANVAVASTFNLTAGKPRVGGLIGTANAASVFASCARGDVSAAGKAAQAGGLIGLATGKHVKIRASYAHGGATANGGRAAATPPAAVGAASIASGLVGLSHAVALEITASYSTGAPAASDGTTRGLARIAIPPSGMATVTDSYWDTTSSGVSDDDDADAPEGKTTAQLQSPTSAAAGLYASWDSLDLTVDGVSNPTDAPWDFGTASQYPAINWMGLTPAEQGRP